MSSCGNGNGKSCFLDIASFHSKINSTMVLVGLSKKNNGGRSPHSQYNC